MTTARRLYVSTAGVAALARAAPALGGLAITGAVVLGPTGLSPRDLVRVIDAGAAARFAGWGAWCALMHAPARALFETPSSFVLRWLPIPRWRHAAIVACALAALELPWFALWVVGRGVVDAALAALLAAALHVAAMASARGVVNRLALAAVVALVVCGAPLVACAAAGAAAIAVGFDEAYWGAPAREGRRSAPFARRPIPALAWAWWLSIARADVGVPVRAAVAALACGACAGIARANAPHAVALVDAALAASLVAAPLASAAVAGPLVDLELRLAWMLDASATAPSVRVAARALVLGALGVIVGGLSGALVCAIAGLAWPAIAAAVAAGCASAVAVAALAPGTARRDRCDRLALLLRAGLVAAGSVALVLAFSARALAPVALGALALLAVDHRAARVARRP